MYRVKIFDAIIKDSGQFGQDASLLEGAVNSWLQANPTVEFVSAESVSTGHDVRRQVRYVTVLVWYEVGSDNT